ncbi:MAG: flagellar biosynthetic protein FliR [Treponema sp.]|nr:MAG: flagellar biosynthetic protein FliR [Treponema sp.]
MFVLENLVSNIPIFFLCFARVFALILTSPLLSMRTFSRITKVGLAFLITILVMPTAYPSNMMIDPFSLHYLLLIIGEALLGVITGFFVSIIFSTFSSAGQFFSYQMGFAASSVYDSLAKIQNPLMGQFFNFVAVLVFISIDGFQKLFLGGILRSFESINCFIFVDKQELVVSLFFKSLSLLFYNAMVICLPIMGTLFLVHVSMGLFTKAAPQMNLLSEGFPMTILLTFLILSFAMPYLINLFVAIIENAFFSLEELFIKAGGIR